MVKSLVTSHMFNENDLVPYENVEMNPQISLRKIIGTTEFFHMVTSPDRDDVIDFHINYEQVPTKDAKLKDPSNS